MYQDFRYTLAHAQTAVFSPRIIQGMSGGRGLGVACGHIKAFGLFPFPHQRRICSEGLQGRHALSMLGRTLDSVYQALFSGLGTRLSMHLVLEIVHVYVWL